MLKKLIAVAVLLGVLILIGGVVLWMQSLVPEQHQFVLFNGSVVTFKQATFGTNHVIARGGRWQTFLPKFITRRFQSPTSSSFSTPGPSVMLWFERRQMPGMSGQDYGCSVVHADGTETPFETSRHYANWTPTNTLEGMPAAYPQREKILRIRFYERKTYDDATLLGEFTLANPNVSHAPIKSAPPLPQKARDGDLEITLTSLDALKEDRGRNTSFLNQGTRARFLVTEAGTPSLNWTVQGMTAVDSMGNRLVANSWSGGTQKQFENFECRPTLWPSESYKLRFEFSRKAEALFDTNEVWTIRGVAMPADGGFTLVNTQWNTGKFTVLFHGLAAKGATPPWQQQFSGETALGFSVMPMPEGHRFTLVGATDEAGRKVEGYGSGYSNTNWGFGLRLKGKPQSLDVTVALHRSRFVDFVAQPAKWDGKYSP